MSTAPPSPARKFAFPPIIYLSCFAAGSILEFMLPSDFMPATLQYWIGGAILVCSLVPMPFVLARFKKAGTSFKSRGSTTTLIRDGPYRFSRNPGYLSMTLLYLGLAVLIDSAWLFLLLAVGFVLMNTMVVAREEADLEKQFGAAYRDYKASVRRWI